MGGFGSLWVFLAGFGRLRSSVAIKLLKIKLFSKQVQSDLQHATKNFSLEELGLCNMFSFKRRPFSE